MSKKIKVIADAPRVFSLILLHYITPTTSRKGLVATIGGIINGFSGAESGVS